MSEKYRGKEIFFWNERKSAFVTYDRFGMGMKYAVYSVRDGIKRYCTSFDSPTKAYEYCKKIV